MWVASVYHWLTFRGLHTDRPGAFAADHRLAFRGLPAEGLWVQTHEAAPHTTLLAGANEELRRRQRAGLSSGERGHSSHEAQVFRDTAASSHPEARIRSRTDSIVAARAFLGTIAPAGSRTILDCSSGTDSIVGDAASVGHANRGGGPRPQGHGRWFALPSGRRRRGSLPIHMGRGILGVGPWICLIFQKYQFWKMLILNKE